MVLKKGLPEGVVNSYIEQLPVHVRPYWKLPSYLMNKNLKCRVRIFLTRKGRLIKIELFESSGSLEYDKRALAAVKRSDPFPSLPSEIQELGVNGSILLGFPL